jgi:hypothetical protein
VYQPGWTVEVRHLQESLPALQVSPGFNYNHDVITSYVTEHDGEMRI